MKWMNKMHRANTQSTKKIAIELFFSASADPLSGRTGSGDGVVVVFEGAGASDELLTGCS